MGKNKTAKQPLAVVPPVKRRHMAKSPPDSAGAAAKVKPFCKDKRFQKPEVQEKEKPDKSEKVDKPKVLKPSSTEKQDKTTSTTSSKIKTDEPRTSKTTRPSALKTSLHTREPTGEAEKSKGKEKKKLDALREKIEKLEELQSGDGSNEEGFDDMDAELSSILEATEKDKKKQDQTEESNEESDSSSNDGDGYDSTNDDEDDDDDDGSSNGSKTESEEDTDGKGDTKDSPFASTAIVPHEDPGEKPAQRNSTFPLHIKRKKVFSDLPKVA